MPEQPKKHVYHCQCMHALHNNGHSHAQSDISMDMLPLENVTENERFEERSRRPSPRSAKTASNLRRRDRRCRSGGRIISLHNPTSMVLGRGRPLNMTVNNQQDSDAPRALTPMPGQGPDEASGGNELESEHYDEIPIHRDP